MNKKNNCGTVINREGGVKNRFFKIVLYFCLGVVSLLGFTVKMTANAQVLDIDTEKIITSDNEYLSNILSFNYDGYFDIVGYTGAKIEFRLYDFDGSVYDYNQWFVSTTTQYLYSPKSAIWLLGYNTGFAVSTYQDLPGFCINLSSVASCLSFIDVCYFKFFPNGTAVTDNLHYFCSKQLYNQYLTMQNSSSGYTYEDLQSSYNTGYSAGITEGTTTGYNSGYNEGYTAGYDKCEDDSIPLMQEKWQNGYDIGKGEGINEGISQGYNNGYNAGLEDNQPLVYQAGYEEGHLTGKSLGFDQGYNNAKEEYYSDQSNFKSLIFSIIDAPFNVLSNAFDFEIFGINMSSFLIAIVSLLLVAFVIRKLM